jgi:glutamate-1-semialdehyde aminotransferase
MSGASKKLRKQTDYTLHKRAQSCIAQGYLTNSKRPESLVMGVYPTHLRGGLGCHVWDYEDKKYIDFMTGLGTNLLGYANETINTAVVGALRQGNLLSLGTENEILAAEKLKEVIPFVDCFKFLKTGTEACAAAVRIARAHTKREWVLSEGYHGWSDGFISLTPPHAGVSHRDNLKYSNLKEVSFDFFDRVAAVIVEPIITDTSKERIAYLTKLREECTKHGALLIFDEVITGLRFPRFSASSYFGITPDLICLGKAIANGFPLAAVGGKYHVMNTKDPEYFVSSSYAGCSDALVACTKVIELLQKSFRLDELWEEGGKFISEFNSIWPEKLAIEGYPTRGVFKGDNLVKALFFQEACYAGIIFCPSFFFNFPLMKEASSVLSTSRDIMYRIKSGAVKLEGQVPTSPFAQKVREA